MATEEQEISTKEPDQSIEQPEECKQPDDGQAELLDESEGEEEGKSRSHDEGEEKVESESEHGGKEKGLLDSDDDGEEKGESESEDRGKKKRLLDSDDEGEEKGEPESGDGGKKKRLLDSDDEGEEKGESESEDGDGDEEKGESESEDGGKEKGEIESDEDRPANNTVYDFDIMMAKKKEANSRKRRRRNYDIINDNDDMIADIINQMKESAEADAEANRNKQAAIRKLKLLPFVIGQLRKIELRDAFLDSDVLSVITEWLAPLPDKNLPHIQIRESLLKTLIDLNLYDVDRIKGSGIGKAVMYLYKHPKESRENKQRAKHLISCWSRPIFQLDSSFNAISREEREQRDLELMSKHRRASQGDAGPSTKKPKEDNVMAQKPGDKGWIPRARVPAPSMRDYVIRPQSKVDGDIGKNSKRPANMLEKYMKSQQDRRRAGKQQRAVNIKIDKG